jgi:hypothetical protein
MLVVMLRTELVLSLNALTGQVLIESSLGKLSESALTGQMSSSKLGLMLSLTRLDLSANALSTGLVTSILRKFWCIKAFSCLVVTQTGYMVSMGVCALYPQLL